MMETPAKWLTGFSNHRWPARKSSAEIRKDFPFMSAHLQTITPVLKLQNFEYTA